MKASSSPVKVWTDPKGVEWVLIECPYCHADLSKVSHGRTVRVVGIEMEVFETFHPLRCSECAHPLLPVPKRSPVMPAGNPLS